MTVMEMLGQSAILTLLGMGVVFLFLIILVICISLSSRVIKALKLDKDEESGAVGVQSTAGQNDAVIAAIAAAVRQKDGC